MKKTFVTNLPDQVGSFMQASNCISQLNLNITRVSYNKAIDIHTLFLEVEGTKEELNIVSKKLEEIGYLQKQESANRVILIEFKLIDKPGSVLSILQLISNYSFNISYISSQENGTNYQYFKMGLLIDNNKKIEEFLKEVTKLCEIKIINFDKTEKNLDNTVFYISFANEIAEKMKLNEDDKAKLMVNSNIIMQNLDDRNSPPYKTFQYIGKFAEFIYKYKNEAFIPRITSIKLNGELVITLIEPPCGSNITILEEENKLIFFDSGFACYADETLKILHSLYNNFDKLEKNLILTHADADHTGLIDIFDNVYLNQKCYDNFIMEKNGENNYREQNPLYLPYVKISKILTSYTIPNMNNFKVVGGTNKKLQTYILKIADLNFKNLNFEVYEGCGGHVDGENIFIERKHKLLFSGDLFVNIKGFTPPQAEFNALAPYLMTSVDTDPISAARERIEIFNLLDNGVWHIFGGHGSVKIYEKK